MSKVVHRLVELWISHAREMGSFEASEADAPEAETQASRSSQCMPSMIAASLHARLTRLFRSLTANLQGLLLLPAIKTLY